MNFFLFYKSFSDIDTLAPIVNILSKNNTPKKKIFILMHSLGRSTNLNNNELMFFLKNHAKVFNFKIFNYINRVYYFLMGSTNITRLKKKIFLFRFINSLIKKSIQYSFTLYLCMILLFLFLIKKKTTVLFFGSINEFYCKLIKFLNKNNKIILIPHGLKTFSGSHDKELNHYFNNRHDKPSIYVDKFIYTNLNQYNLSKLYKNVHFLGSPRYDLTWISKLKKIYKKSLRKKNYILVLLDNIGMNINGNFKSIIKVDEVNVILKYLFNQKYKCIVKFHPNSLENEIKSYNLFKNKIFNVASNEASTFSLIKNCRILIGFNTSSILDGFLLKKKIILPLYCSNLKSLFSSVNNSVVAKNFNIFKNKFKNCIGNSYNQNYNNNNLFLINGNKDSSTSNKYYNLLTSDNE